MIGGSFLEAIFGAIAGAGLLVVAAILARLAYLLGTLFRVRHNNGNSKATKKS